MRACTVLVIGKDAPIREMLTDVLFYEGYLPVSIIGDGQALALGTTLRPDLVLLDSGSSDHPGRAVTQELQARGWDIPIIVLTGVENARQVARAVNARAFLTKPFDLQNLLDLLTRLRPFAI